MCVRGPRHVHGPHESLQDVRGFSPDIHQDIRSHPDNRLDARDYRTEPARRLAVRTRSVRMPAVYRTPRAYPHMCVYMCICVYVYMYICVYVYMCICV